jgi:hypothetical protein
MWWLLVPAAVLAFILVLPWLPWAKPETKDENDEWGAWDWFDAARSLWTGFFGSR